MSSQNQNSLNLKPRPLGLAQIKLLEAVRDTGSMSQAAKQQGISYKTAWEWINHMNNRSVHPIVTRETGGKSGGGTSLTHHGEKLLFVYHELKNMQEAFLTRQDSDPILRDISPLFEAQGLQLSARNQFFGTVSSISSDEVFSRIYINLDGITTVFSGITTGSAKKLQIKKGSKVCAIIKATSIALYESCPQSLCPETENILKGKIHSISTDKSHHEVQILMGPGTTLTAMLPVSEKTFAFKKRQDIFACFNFHDVLIGI